MMWRKFGQPLRPSLVQSRCRREIFDSTLYGRDDPYANKSYKGFQKYSVCFWHLKVII